MVRLSVCAILAWFCFGCSYSIQEYGPLRNVEINVLGKLDDESADLSAKDFEDQVNKQFESNIKIPKLPFRAGRYVDSVIESGGLMLFKINGEF